tara:strand:- start:958 stop:1164 length:207 start_codon:yes stop_codon:yes gene_type:complete
MALEREKRFMADTSPLFAMANTHGDGNNNAMADHYQATAAAAIGASNLAFNGKNEERKGGAGGTRRLK